MQEAAHALGILFVVDEVITGFGRTGPMFACDDEGVEPDIMILAKGLTSGYIPMAATLFSDDIYSSIAEHAGEQLVGHGHTYSGHPVAAAVALEVIALYEEGLLAHARRIAPQFARVLDGFAGHPLVGNVRHRGLLGALELVTDKATKRSFDPALGLPAKISQLALRQQLMLRAFPGHILGFAPALCFGERECELLGQRLARLLDDILALPEVRAAMTSIA